MKQVKNSGLGARYVFIQPPSVGELEARLRLRGTDAEAAIQKRLARATAELEYAATGVHDKVIVNGDVEVAYKELEEYILGAK